jgi:hypothetical protein
MAILTDAMRYEHGIPFQSREAKYRQPESVKVGIVNRQPQAVVFGHRNSLIVSSSLRAMSAS